MGCLISCATSICTKILQFLLGILKIACAIAILVIIPLYLVDVNVKVEYDDGMGNTATSPSLGKVDCYLGSFQDELTGDTSVNLCYYAYIVAAVSLVATVILFFFLCFTCGCCCLGWILELAFAALGTCWWLAAAIVLTKASKEANNDGFTEEDWRTAVLVAAWTATGAFALTLLISIFKIFDKICCCCTCLL